MDIRTIQDQVVIEVEFADQTSASGIYLGEGEMKNEGTVVAVGPGRKNSAGLIIPVDVKIGDRVLFDPASGHPITVLKRRLLVTSEAQIIGVLS